MAPLRCHARSSVATHQRQAAPASRGTCVVVLALAQKTGTPVKPAPAQTRQKEGSGVGLGDLLGPIGMTVGTSVPEREQKPSSQAQAPKSSSQRGPGLGDLLGPIGLTVGTSVQEREQVGARPAGATGDDEDGGAAGPGPGSIHSMTTEQWRAAYEQGGAVDLWMEDEFNAGSRLVGGRAVHKGGVYGFRTGEGVSAGGDVAVHKVKIFDHYGNQELELEVPEDRYILWEAEDKGLELPYACRMGCCTACAVRVKEGSVYQPEALGISQELRDEGYALMCVGFPTSDAVLETVSEDEIYDLQFGRHFATQALDPRNPATIERDDYALSIANMDE